MRTLALAALLALSACGGDDPPKKYMVAVSCSITCDGTTQMQSFGSVCDTEENISKGLAETEDACNAQLGDCTTHTCTCTVNENPPECK